MKEEFRRVWSTSGDVRTYIRRTRKRTAVVQQSVCVSRLNLLSLLLHYFYPSSDTNNVNRGNFHALVVWTGVGIVVVLVRGVG